MLEVIGRAHAGARDCGPITWDETTMRRWLTRPGTYADRDRYAYLAQDGFLAYHWRRGHDEIFVDRLVASTAEATAALWAVAASNSSVAETVRALVGPSDPLWWMLREQDANIAERQSWMLRLLDAPAAIAARGFPATDLAVPLQITDDLRPANSGRWELTVRAGTGRLSPCRTDDVPAPDRPASPAGPALAWVPAGWPRSTPVPRWRPCAGPAWPRAAAPPPTPPWTARSPRRRSCSTTSDGHAAGVAPRTGRGPVCSTRTDVREPGSADRDRRDPGFDRPD